MSWTPESSGGNRPWPPGSPLRGREGMPPHEWSQVVRHRGITAHVAGLFVATVRPKCDFEVPLAGITLLPLGVLRGDGEGMPAGPPTSPRDRARCGAEPHEADGAGCRQAPREGRCLLWTHKRRLLRTCGARQGSPKSAMRTGGLPPFGAIHSIKLLLIRRSPCLYVVSPTWGACLAGVMCQKRQKTG